MLVQRYPTSPDAAQARFRMGEIDFAAGRFDEAVAEYRQLIADFPRHDLAPDALYRSGEALLQLDLARDALVAFRDVETRYPGTTAAVRARERLVGLSGARTRGHAHGAAWKRSRVGEPPHAGTDQGESRAAHGGNALPDMRLHRPGRPPKNLSSR
jgi:tetratricopeptide (TPR) repeat protein